MFNVLLGICISVYQCSRHVFTHVCLHVLSLVTCAQVADGAGESAAVRQSAGHSCVKCCGSVYRSGRVSVRVCLLLRASGEDTGLVFTLTS